MTPSELDINAAAVLQQKETKIKLETSINTLTESEKALDEKIKLKEKNLKSLTNSVDKANKELEEKEKNIKIQQDMVEKVMKEKNEAMLKDTDALEKSQKENDKIKEKLETERQKIESIKVTVVTKQKEVELKEFENEQKEKSIELQIETLTKKEKEVKLIRADSEKYKKETINAEKKLRNENEKQRKINETSDEKTRTFQAEYKKANAEKQQNQDILSAIDNAVGQVRTVSIVFRQEFERLVGILGAEMNFVQLIGPEFQKAAGMALLGNVYTDKKAFKEILKQVKGFEEIFEESEKDELVAKIEELEAKVKGNTGIETVVESQADELKNAEAKLEDNVDKINNAKNKEIEELKAGFETEKNEIIEEKDKIISEGRIISDRLQSEYKEIVIENNDLKTELASKNEENDVDKEKVNTDDIDKKETK